MFSDSTPLSIVANVLVSTTVESVLRSPSYHTRVWKILDSWPLKCPERLRRLEADGEIILLGRLFEQQGIEHQVMGSTVGLQLRSRSHAEHEILSLSEIDTEL